MPFLQLQPEQVAQQRYSQETQHQIRHAAVWEFPSEQYPDYIDQQNRGIDDQGRGKDVIDDYLQDFIVLRYRRGMVHGPAAEQRDYDQGNECVGIGKPFVLQMQVEKEIHGGYDGGHDAHKQGSYGETQSHLEGYVKDVPAVGFVVQRFLADEKENQGENICHAKIPSQVLGSPKHQRNP